MVSQDTITAHYPESILLTNSPHFQLLYFWYQFRYYPPIYAYMVSSFEGFWFIFGHLTYPPCSTCSSCPAYLYLMILIILEIEWWSPLLCIFILLLFTSSLLSYSFTIFEYWTLNTWIGLLQFRSSVAVPFLRSCLLLRERVYRAVA
jgi:hypothetical protein